MITTPKPPRHTVLLLTLTSLIALSACDPAAPTRPTAHLDTATAQTPTFAPSSAPSTPAPTTAYTPPSGPPGLAVVSLGYSGGLELLDGSGKVVASAAAPKPRTAFRDPPNTTEYGSSNSDLMPYYSASKDRLYYLNGDSDIWVLAPGTKARLVKRLPVGHLQHAGFAVSPDDKTIAVAIIDYSVTPHRLRVYTEDLADSAGHRDVLTSTREYEWPIGFVGTDLVMAIGPASAQSGSYPYNALYGYDLLSPNGAHLRAFCTAPAGSSLPYGTMSGPVDPQGAVCTTTAGHAFESWTGKTSALPDQACGGQVAVSYSPDRALLMCTNPPNPTTTMDQDTVATADGHELAHMQLGPGGYGPYEWVDDGHVVESGNLLDIAHDTVTPLPPNSNLVAVVPGDLY